MNREEMAEAVEDAARIADSDEAILVADELRVCAAELRKTCEWKSDEDGIFHTGCGHDFQFTDDGGPTENLQKFCGYCGGSLIEVEP